MKSEQIITILSSLLGSGVIIAVLNYFNTRRKAGVEGRVAEATEKVQIGLVSVQELEAKLGYLNRVISVLEQHNVRLEGDLDNQYQMNTQLNSRVRELTHRCDQFEAIIRRLCLENGLNADALLNGSR